MKKVLQGALVVAAGAGITYLAKQGRLKLALDKIKQLPLVAMVKSLRSRAANDDRSYHHDYDQARQAAG
jgi:hypothetical protein